MYFVHQEPTPESECETSDLGPVPSRVHAGVLPVDHDVTKVARLHEYRHFKHESYCILLLMLIFTTSFLVNFLSCFISVFTPAAYMF